MQGDGLEHYARSTDNDDNKVTLCELLKSKLRRTELSDNCKRAIILEMTRI